MTLAVQDVNGLSNPPAGTVIEKRTDAPEIVPETDPRPVRPVVVSVIDTVPENDVSVWVICHAIAPGPVESDAGPLHVPLKLVVGPGDGAGVGDVALDPLLPPQPNDTSAHKASARSAPTRR